MKFNYFRAPRARASGEAAGFTLVEVLVTVVVIALGCLAVMWLQSAARRGNAQSDHLTAATFLAESEIERLKSLSFEDAKAEAEDNESSPVVKYLDRRGREAPAGAQGGDARYPYKRTVRYYPKQPTSLSQQVEVDIEWRTSLRTSSLSYTAALTDFSF